MNTEISKRKTQVKAILWFFIIALIVSGATAIPVETELKAVLPLLPENSGLSRLLTIVLNAVQSINTTYPFLFYGYDWLAFDHFVIAVAFIGPLKDPVKNIWVFEFGMIACLMIIPFALIVGGFRELPIWWRLIDCSFGVFGFIPLWICRRKTMEIERLIEADKLNIVF